MAGGTVRPEGVRNAIGVVTRTGDEPDADWTVSNPAAAAARVLAPTEGRRRPHGIRAAPHRGPGSEISRSCDSRPTGAKSQPAVLAFIIGYPLTRRGCSCSSWRTTWAMCFAGFRDSDRWHQRQRDGSDSLNCEDCVIFWGAVLLESGRSRTSPGTCPRFLSWDVSRKPTRASDVLTALIVSTILPQSR